MSNLCHFPEENDREQQPRELETEACTKAWCQKWCLETFFKCVHERQGETRCAVLGSQKKMGNNVANNWRSMETRAPWTTTWISCILMWLWRFVTNNILDRSKFNLHRSLCNCERRRCPTPSCTVFINQSHTTRMAKSGGQRLMPWSILWWRTWNNTLAWRKSHVHQNHQEWPIHF